MIWCIKTWIAYVKIQKHEEILSIMINLQLNCSLKVEFQKVEINKKKQIKFSIEHEYISDTESWIWPGMHSYLSGKTIN